MVFFACARRNKEQGDDPSIPDGTSENVANDFMDSADGGEEEDEGAYSRLSPKEAFEKFDANGSGDIDEDEFFHLLECIGVTSDEEYQERLFHRYAKKVSGGSNRSVIDYDGFKSAWLLLGNPRRELIERGVRDVPKFATRHQLVRLLEKTIDEEERLEGLARAEADRYRTLQDKTNARRECIRMAKNRAGLELAAALDAAGGVYVLGRRAVMPRTVNLLDDLKDAITMEAARDNGSVADPACTARLDGIDKYVHHRRSCAFALPKHRPHDGLQCLHDCWWMRCGVTTCYYSLKKYQTK
jgi:hypothetical protein